jgi:hypothetical protein
MESLCADNSTNILRASHLSDENVKSVTTLTDLRVVLILPHLKCVQKMRGGCLFLGPFNFSEGKIERYRSVLR